MLSQQIVLFEQFVNSAEACRQWAERAVLPNGLSSSQFRALGALVKNGKLKQNAIARYLNKTDGNVTVVVENLHKRGLVERNRDENDRRVVLITVTEKGRKLYEDLYPVYVERVKSVIQDLGVEDHQAMERLAANLVEAMKKGRTSEQSATL